MYIDIAIYICASVCILYIYVSVRVLSMHPYLRSLERMKYACIALASALIVGEAAAFAPAATPALRGFTTLRMTQVQ